MMFTYDIKASNYETHDFLLKIINLSLLQFIDSINDVSNSDLNFG